MYINKVVNAMCRQKIEQAFKDLFFVACFYAKKDFAKNEKQGKKWEIARALVFLEDVSQNPDKHFAYEFTNAAWDARVEDYIAKSATAEKSIAEHGIDYVRSVVKGSRVDSPSGIVFNKISPLFKPMDLLCFCQNVQDFYYQKHYKCIYVNHAEIINFANKVAKSAKILKQKNSVKRGLQLFFKNDLVR